MRSERVPERIGRYQIVREVGRGGMGVVYEARDEAFGRTVALKVLPGEQLHDDSSRARFLREARLIAALEYEGIVPVYDFDEEEGRPFFVMRFMGGGSLADRLRERALEPEEVVALVEELAPALDEAHRRAIIHRDLKPGNILFDEQGMAHLSDFGIARLVAEGQETRSQLLGTPAYMSPEQVEGSQRLDGRSDLYSLGVIVWELLTGAPPYQGERPIEVALKHNQAPVPSLRAARPELPAALDSVLTRALAKRPEERFQSAAALARALRAAVPTAPAIAGPRAARRPAELGAPALRRGRSAALLLLPLLLAGLLLGRLTLDRPPSGDEPGIVTNPTPSATGVAATATRPPAARTPILPTRAVGSGGLAMVTSTPLPGLVPATPTATAAPGTPPDERDRPAARVVTLLVPASGATVAPRGLAFSAQVTGLEPGESVALLLGPSETLGANQRAATMQRSGDRYSAMLQSLAPGRYWWTVVLYSEQNQEVARAPGRTITVSGGDASSPSVTPRPAQPSATPRPAPTSTAQPSPSVTVPPTRPPAPATAVPPPPPTQPPAPTAPPPTSPPPPTAPPTHTPAPPTPRPTDITVPPIPTRVLPTETRVPTATPYHDPAPPTPTRPPGGTT